MIPIDSRLPLLNNPTQFRRIQVYRIIFLLIVFFTSCAEHGPWWQSDASDISTINQVPDQPTPALADVTEPPPAADFEFGGGEGFKVPLPPGYNWEITQSWASHCSACAEDYTDWSYCSLSHVQSCCLYSWDFNLPGSADLGKPFLASKAGKVTSIVNSSGSSGWGTNVVIDHGNNICTRSAHLVFNSANHLTVGQNVCQGLQIGQIGSTGAAEGSHAHFQFEHCNNPGISIPMGFEDGNGIPVCTRGSDRFDNQGNYTALILNNQLLTSCSGQTTGVPSGTDHSALNSAAIPVDLPRDDDKFYTAHCGPWPQCPFNQYCQRTGIPVYHDWGQMSQEQQNAVEYLWLECAIDKTDFFFEPSRAITRAEGLKIALILFGLDGTCPQTENFSDVSSEDWFYKPVNCGLHHGIISSGQTFQPNSPIKFIDLVKVLVSSGVESELIQLNAEVGQVFPQLPVGHWAENYLETMHYYGGIKYPPESYILEGSVTRAQASELAASLSRCYAGNIECLNSSCYKDQQNFECALQCVPNCNGKECGSNGCGGSCGTCPHNESCNSQSQCQSMVIECVPNCNGKSCGNDGCGGVCGHCPFDHNCSSQGQCLPICDPPTCQERGLECGTHSNLCNSEPLNCGSCSAEEYCLEGKCEERCPDDVDPSTPVNPCSECPDPTACSEGKCVIDGWACDPEQTYELMITVHNGIFDLIISDSLDVQEIDMQEVLNLQLGCRDFPLAFLAYGLPGSNLEVEVGDGMPLLAIWLPYFEELELTPPNSPNILLTEIESLSAGMNLLVRLPPPQD